MEKLPDFEAKWRDKVRQLQIPIFLEHTDAAWQIQFDDVIANALLMGPLQEMDKIIYPVCKLCPDHEKAGFIEGITIGIRLNTELQI